MNWLLVSGDAAGWWEEVTRVHSLSWYLNCGLPGWSYPDYTRETSTTLTN